MAPVEQAQSNLNINLNAFNSNFNKLSHDMFKQILMTKQSNEDPTIKLNGQPEPTKGFSFSVDSLLNSSTQIKKELNNNSHEYDAIKSTPKNNSLTNSINTNTDYEEDYNDEIEEEEEDKKRCTSSVSFSDYSEENSSSEFRKNENSHTAKSGKLSNEFSLNSLRGLHGNFGELNGLANNLENSDATKMMIQNGLVQTANGSLPQHMQQFLNSNPGAPLAGHPSANSQLNEQLTAMMNAGFMPPYSSLLNSGPIGQTINNTLASLPSSPYFNSLFPLNPAIAAAAAAASVASSNPLSSMQMLPKPEHSSNLAPSLSSYQPPTSLHQPLHALNHTLNINNSFNSKYAYTISFELQLFSLTMIVRRCEIDRRSRFDFFDFGNRVLMRSSSNYGDL